MILKYVCIYIYIYIYIYYHVLYVLCVVFFVYFFSNLYLYNTVLSVLFCVNKDIIIHDCALPPCYSKCNILIRKCDWRTVRQTSDHTLHTMYLNAKDVILIVVGFAPHLEVANFVSRLFRVASLFLRWNAVICVFS